MHYTSLAPAHGKAPYRQNGEGKNGKVAQARPGAGGGGREREGERDRGRKGQGGGRGRLSSENTTQHTNAYETYKHTHHHQDCPAPTLSPPPPPPPPPPPLPPSPPLPLFGDGKRQVPTISAPTSRAKCVLLRCSSVFLATLTPLPPQRAPEQAHVCVSRAPAGDVRA
jgi:hypothetical protein